MISGTDLIKNEEETCGINEERNILRKIKGMKAKWKNHFLRKNCLLNYVIFWKDRRKDRGDRKRRKVTG